MRTIFRKDSETVNIFVKQLPSSTIDDENSTASSSTATSKHTLNLGQRDDATCTQCLSKSTDAENKLSLTLQSKWDKL